LVYNYLSDTRSLYIHWPFCPYKCHFCPFVALAGLDRYMPEYHAALIKEIEKYGRECSSKAPLDTIFFGGGTPSTYPDHLLLDTFGRLRDVFNLNEIREVTIEVNPGTVRQEQLALWKELGISRLSIGVQSLKDGVLHALNRLQKQTDVQWLVHRAAADFDNISIDLILGLPGVSEEEWKQLMQTIVQWPISHVSLYFLTVHEDTQLYFKVQKNQVVLPPDNKVVDTYLWSVQWLQEHGFEQYEVSNFARDDKRSLHNQVYWERKPYKGFGLGACSFDGINRFQNQKNLIKYLQTIQEEGDITIFAESLNAEQKHLEQIMLGLRRSSGVLLQHLCLHDIQDHYDLLEQKVMALQAQGLVNRNGDTLVLTVAGLATHNAVVINLICNK